MKIQFLGTTAGLPSKSRNVSSLALDFRQEKEGFWLIDCGEATQHQILHTNIKPPKISKIFLTHLHGDHLFGIFGLLATISNLGRTEELEIIAPKGTEQLINHVLSASSTYLTFNVKYTVALNGLSLSYPNFDVDVLELDHDIQTFAYRISQHDSVGSLNIDKAEALGVFGKDRGLLKKGLDVTLQDGRIVKPSDVLGENIKGKVITIFGDTEFNDYFIEFAKNSDTLVYEGTLTPEDKLKNPKIKHSTFVDACKLASLSDSKRLLVNHVSSRYINQELEQLKLDASKLFENSHIVSDFDTFTI